MAVAEGTVATATTEAMAAATAGATTTTMKAEMQKDGHRGAFKLLNARLFYCTLIPLHNPVTVLTLHMNAPIINVVFQENWKAGFS